MSTYIQADQHEAGSQAQATRIAKEIGLTRQAVYRVKGDLRVLRPALVTWGL